MKALLVEHAIQGGSLLLSHYGYQAMQRVCLRGRKMSFPEHYGVWVLLHGSRLTITISFLCLLLGLQSSIVYSYIT